MERIQLIHDYCDEMGASCRDCKIKEKCERVAGNFVGNSKAVDLAYEKIKDLNVSNNDNVNHPSHYCREGGMESIEEMIEVFGKSAVMSFCLCNVWKYRYRAADKNGAEDLKKSDWYMKKYIELRDNA